MSSAPLWYRDWLARAEALDAVQVFFIVGCQKSGTTWVQKLLDAHPHVVCRGEAHLADTLLKLLQQAFAAYNQSQLQRRRSAQPFLLQDSDLKGSLRLLFAQLLQRYLAAEREPQAILAVGDKTPEHANSIRLLAELLPGSKFIHIIRDGRDGVASGWAHLQRIGEAGKFATLAEYAEYFAQHHWKPYILNAHAAGCDLPGRFIELKYEDLHADPLPWTQRLLRFLGVDDGADVASSCIDAASFDRLSGGRAAGDEDRSSHFRKGIVGDWRTQLDADAVRRFESHAGELLSQLGYRDSIDEEFAPSAEHVAFST